jgi:NADH-quinone oxidoreductase subunit H
MNSIATIFTLLLFPSGVFVVVAGLMYEWAARKTLARLQNRIGPRWMQPFADVLKLLSKEESSPPGSTASCSWPCRWSACQAP